MTVPIRVVVADDEALARQRLRDLLRPHPGFVLVGEAADGREAGELIRSMRPDLVFLDIKMPEADGFAVLKNVTGPAPLIIFVTAYDNQAVEAFTVEAADYLVKPVDKRRFAEALRRVPARLRMRVPPENASSTPDTPGPATYRTRFAARRGDHIQLVDVSDVAWIDAQGNYIRLHTGEGRFLVRQTIGAAAAQLDPRQFLRIHRRLVVGLAQIRKVVSRSHGEYAFTLKDGTELTSSRSYSAAVTGLFS